MITDIGSEFWIEDILLENVNKRNEWLSKFGDIALTSSGRGAITLLLKQINPRFKTVLLPSYICESVTLPFIEQGYDCYFYNINDDLSVEIESIKLYKDIGVFVHIGYYGFATNSNLVDLVKQLKLNSTVIVEDITHTMFSSYQRNLENDFYIGSIRKWFGLPSGGLLASSKVKVEGTNLICEEFSKLRLEALLKKNEYIKTNEQGLKHFFLNLFAEAEEILDKDLSPYCIDDLSRGLINTIDAGKLIYKRRSNFQILSDGIKNINYVEPLFHELVEDICPMYYPIYVNANREHVRQELIKNKIYCPIHWPIPRQINNKSLGIYNKILSIPCDQRYEDDDMKRILSVLENLQYEEEINEY
ncbi:hypothetical protein RBU61_15550 [Tissierella sp. MB52-C2]|uniref:hypothetical protein n=1 Tax=Tissierella sp. MB52-C2 TaxID=3070999 RepID=UPI00280B29E8|nr:hypothetical protein [Tissierella sp. MB52-C2]WMM24329.1 hypothetical protein RBU61_15550 [Tissierella sp. MB52-C2]